jgi:hypothetical protein
MWRARIDKLASRATWVGTLANGSWRLEPLLDFAGVASMLLTFELLMEAGFSLLGGPVSSLWKPNHYSLLMRLPALALGGALNGGRVALGCAGPLWRGREPRLGVPRHRCTPSLLGSAVTKLFAQVKGHFLIGVAPSTPIFGVSRPARLWPARPNRLPRPPSRSAVGEPRSLAATVAVAPVRPSTAAPTCS